MPPADVHAVRNFFIGRAVGRALPLASDQRALIRSLARMILRIAQAVSGGEQQRRPLRFSCQQIEQRAAGGCAISKVIILVRIWNRRGSAEILRQRAASSLALRYVA